MRKDIEREGKKETKRNEKEVKQGKDRT